MKTTQRLHIVHIASSLEVGGISNLIFGIATASPLSHHQHSVICIVSAEGELLKRYRKAGINVYECRIHWPRRRRFIPSALQEWIRSIAEKTFATRLSWLLKRIKADVVHMHLPRRIDLIAHSVVELSRLYLVWSIHGQNLYFNERDENVLKAGKDLLLKSKRARITADSQILKSIFMKHFPEAESIFHVVHPGANTQQFRADIPKDPDWRKNLRIPETAIVFGSCGRLAPVKGYDVFVRAAAQLIAQGIDAHFAISGKGDESENLLRLAEELGISKNFHFLGFQKNLAYTIKQFDVFILSSRSEGFPLSLIEALAAGLPCIATDISGVREMLGEQTGLVIPPESPEALKEAMIKMLDKQLRERFSKEATLRGQIFSFEHCASEFENLYLELQAQETQ